MKRESVCVRERKGEGQGARTKGVKVSGQRKKKGEGKRARTKCVKVSGEREKGGKRARTK